MQDDKLLRLRELAKPGTSLEDVGGVSVFADAASEIVRLRDEVAILRLSQEECDAIRDAMQGYSAWMLDHVSLDRDDTQAVLYRLNGILERHSPWEVK